MKAFASHIIIGIGVLLVLTFSMKQAITWCSFQLNQEYIAAFLCEQKDNQNNSCQGQCVLQEQLDQEKQESPVPTEQSEQKVDFIFEKTSYSFGECQMRRCLPGTIPLSNWSYLIGHDIFHPPRCV